MAYNGPDKAANLVLQSDSNKSLLNNDSCSDSYSSYIVLTVMLVMKTLTQMSIAKSVKYLCEQTCFSEVCISFS